MPTDILSEEFRPVADFPGYRVSNLGRVQSCLSPVWITGGRRGNIRWVESDEWRDLKLNRHRSGHMFVALGKRAYRKDLSVHSLVVTAFVGPRPPGMQCRHLDGNPANNRVDNLCWGTAAENYADRVRHGTDNAGVKNYRTKLTEVDVLAVRSMAAGGLTQDEIAARFGVSASVVSKILTGRTWRHVTGGAAKDRRKGFAHRRGVSDRLDADKVREIRRMAGRVLQRELAVRFGVSIGTISDIVRRKCWAHVPDSDGTPDYQLDP